MRCSEIGVRITSSAFFFGSGWSSLLVGNFCMFSAIQYPKHIAGSQASLLLWCWSNFFVNPVEYVYRCLMNCCYVHKNSMLHICQLRWMAHYMTELVFSTLNWIAIQEKGGGGTPLLADWQPGPDRTNGSTYQSNSILKLPVIILSENLHAENHLVHL